MENLKYSIQNYILKRTKSKNDTSGVLHIIGNVKISINSKIVVYILLYIGCNFNYIYEFLFC